MFKNTEPNFSHNHNQILTQPNIPTLNIVTLFLINVSHLICQCPVHNTLELDSLISLTPSCLALLPTTSSPTCPPPSALFGSPFSSGDHCWSPGIQPRCLLAGGWVLLQPPYVSRLPTAEVVKALWLPNPLFHSQLHWPPLRLPTVSSIALGQAPWVPRKPSPLGWDGKWLICITFATPNPLNAILDLHNIKDSFISDWNLSSKILLFRIWIRCHLSLTLSSTCNSISTTLAGCLPLSVSLPSHSLTGSSLPSSEAWIRNAPGFIPAFQLPNLLTPLGGYWCALLVYLFLGVHSLHLQPAWPPAALHPNTKACTRPPLQNQKSGSDKLREGVPPSNSNTRTSHSNYLTPVCKV